MLKKQNGITLVALVVTIVVLLVLAGVSINMVLGDNGIVKKAQEARKNTEQAQQAELAGLDQLLGDLDKIVPSTDGYNEDKKVNSPKLSQGMIPIKWNGNNWVVCSEDDKSWYSYDTTMQWANVMLSDGKYKAGSVDVDQVVAQSELGSMYVWIPRYAYKIAGEKNIEVTFLKGSTNEGTDGVTYTEDESVDTKTTALVHPAFKLAGGELNGIWVSKFEASGTNESGQAVGNASSTSGTPVAPDETTIVKSLPSKISWRHINIGDSQTRSLSITTTNKEKYGLEGASSHLIRNSEWGAVAYLCYSSYGKVPKINGAGSNNDDDAWYNMYTGAGPEDATREGVYGLQGKSTVGGGEFTEAAHGYSTANGMFASTTGNVTGIYDMNGGAWENVAVYLDNSNGNLSYYAGAYFDSKTNELKPEYAAIWEKYEVSEEEKSAAKTAQIKIEENGTAEYLTQGQLWDANKIDLKYQVARLRLTTATFNNMASHKGIGVNEVSNKFSFYAPYYTLYIDENNNTKSWYWFQSAENAAKKPAITYGEIATTWDNDYILIGNVYNAFLIRGGGCSGGVVSGVLYYNNSDGYEYSYRGFRPVLVV